MKNILLGFFLVTMFSLPATHVISSQFEYKYLKTLPGGERQYRLSLVMTRDCSPGAIEFIKDVWVGIYNAGNATLYQTLTVKLSGLANLSPCYGNCRQEGTYTDTINLPANSAGYHVTQLSCCRKPSTNLRLSQAGESDIGTISYCFIPGNTFNTSAFFSADKLLQIKQSFRDTFDFFTYDSDGDSVVVSITPPLEGPNVANPTPPSSFGGLVKIPDSRYTAGFSSIYQLGATSTFSCNQEKKRIIVSCNQEGLYSVAYLIREFRNGVLTGSCIRETVISVANFTAPGKPVIKLNGSWTRKPDISLGWSFFCLENVKKQYIQRSTTNNQNFITIDSVLNTENSYEDKSVSTNGAYFYRIRATRGSGQTVLSDTLPVNFWGLDIQNGKFPGTSFSITPVPAEQFFTVALKGGFIKSCVATDQAGRTLYQGNIPAETNSLMIDCNSWPAGMYFVHVTTIQGEILSRKIIRL
jgi:hypothetical protein